MRVLKEEAAREGRRVTIAVAGCVAQAEGEEIIRRAPVVDLVVGPQSYHRLPELLARAEHGEQVVDTEFPVEDKFDVSRAAEPRGDARARRDGLRHRAGRLRQVLHLLRRALYARRGSVAAGREDRRRSRSPRRRRRARGHADRPERQRLSRRGADGRAWTLGRLLHRVAEIPGIARLRYTTSHPRDMDDDLIAAHRDLPQLMPQLHLPVQSGSDRILAAMNRRHTRADYLRVDRAAARRAARPRASRPISSSAFRARPRRISRDTLALVDEVGYSRRLLVQVFAAARHAGGRR